MPGYSNYDMDAVSDLLFNSFDLIARDADFATNNKIDACIVFAGYCTTKANVPGFSYGRDPTVATCKTGDFSSTPRY